MDDKQVIVQGSTSIEPYFISSQGATIEAIIGGWLQMKYENKSHSDKTRKAYKTTIEDFRAMLVEAGYDLIWNSDSLITTISDYAQVFASLRSGRATRKGSISLATINQRLAILSSFYAYAIKKRHISVGNPIAIIDRPSVEAYAHAQAIEEEELEARLKQIDPNTLQGSRDLALLTLLLSTGRRVMEVASLTRGDLQLSGNQIRITFLHTKGGKTIRDTLAPQVSNLLVKWLNTFYEIPFANIPVDKPVWVNVHHTTKLGKPLGYHGVSGICLHYLGTSKVHTTRHSFAILMELSGAKLTDIQHRLGHENAATTGIYMKKLKQDQNPYAETIARRLGLEG